MRLIVSLPAMLFSVCSYCQTFEIIKNNTDTINRTDKKGHKQGKWIEFYGENGRSETFYKNDKEEGEYFWYNKNNLITSTGFYKNGKEEGVSRGFRNGKLSSTRLYKNGDQVSGTIEYYGNGQAKTGGDYFRGNGLLIEYDSTGFLISSHTYRNNKLHGPFERYFENRQLKEKGIFKNNKYWTIESRFDSLGNKIDFGTIKSGSGSVYWYNNKEEFTKEESYKSGKLWNVFMARIQIKEYGDIGNFKNGNGILKEYDSLGNLICEKTYRNGLLNGVYREYMPVLDMLLVGNCINDNREGEWLRYIRGRIRNMITYKNDIEWGIACF